MKKQKPKFAILIMDKRQPNGVPIIIYEGMNLAERLNNAFTIALQRMSIENMIYSKYSF